MQECVCSLFVLIQILTHWSVSKIITILFATFESKKSQV